MQPITPLTVDYFVAKRTLGADLVDSVSAGKASVVTVAFAAGGVGVVVDGRQTTRREGRCLGTGRRNRPVHLPAARGIPCGSCICRQL